MMWIAVVGVLLGVLIWGTLERILRHVAALQKDLFALRMECIGALYGMTPTQSEAYLGKVLSELEGIAFNLHGLRVHIEDGPTMPSQPP